MPQHLRVVHRLSGWRADHAVCRPSILLVAFLSAPWGTIQEYTTFPCSYRGQTEWVDKLWPIGQIHILVLFVGLAGSDL